MKFGDSQAAFLSDVNRQELLSLITNGGNIEISVGGTARSTCPATTPSCIPAGVSVGQLSDKANIFFNTTGGITAGDPTTVNSFNGRLIKLDTLGALTEITTAAGSSLQAQ